MDHQKVLLQLATQLLNMRTTLVTGLMRDRGSLPREIYQNIQSEKTEITRARELIKYLNWSTAETFHCFCCCLEIAGHVDLVCIIKDETYQNPLRTQLELFRIELIERLPVRDIIERMYDQHTINVYLKQELLAHTTEIQCCRDFLDFLHGAPPLAIQGFYAAIDHFSLPSSIRNIFK